jgi:hypothetical protein
LDLDEQLEEVSKATLGAIQEAHTQRTQKADSIDIELRKLKDFESKMRELSSILKTR